MKSDIVSQVSNVQSIAESTASQVEGKIKANQTKAQLKLLLKNIDSGKFQ